MAGELALRIGRNIRAAREELGLNQRELAAKIDDPAASNMHVSEWERGVRKPSDRYMPLLAEALGKPVDWFYRDHERPDTPALTEALAHEPTQLDRIEADVTEIKASVLALALEMAGLAAVQAKALRQQGRGARGRQPQARGGDAG